MSDDATDKGAEADASEANVTDKEAQAMEWLVGQWGDEIIGQVLSSSLAGPRLFQPHRRGFVGLVSAQPANQLAFAAVDVVLTLVEGAVGLARRNVAEMLGVAVPSRQPEVTPAPAPLTPPQVAAVAAQVAAALAQVAAAVPHLVEAAPEMAAAAPPKAAVPPPLGADVSELPLRLAIKAGESCATCSFVAENTTGHPLHTVRFGLRHLSAGPHAIIPPSHVSFEPAMFELGPHESRVVTVRIKTADARPGSYLGLAESGRFRQVITLEVT